ncbi:hypothetical protein HY413_03345 [Candidatus Kaiserbacteria bacterium]|nr:hypothetical protein [Candidatus Kaiserbacteria bacterium]
MQTCLDTLEGNLRGVIAKMTVEKLLKDREAFQSGVMEEAGVDLGKMGIGVDTFKIQSVTDDRDYIKSLGKKQTAEIVRNATIGEAEAKRDADKASAEARRIGETAQAGSQKAISDANRDRDVAIAENEAKVKAQQAQIPIAAKVAEAERTQELNTATVAAEQARVEAEINLQEVTERRNVAELKATIIASAEKEREARVIKADGEQQAAEREGEASRIREEKDGQGKQAKMTAEALGRIQAATALQKEREAEAAGEKAKLLAGAEGTKAQLLAEAEGILKKAEAFKQLDEAGRLLMILSALPPVIEAVGTALEKVVKPAAEAIGEGIGNIKEVRIIDLGGGSGESGRSVLSQFSNLPVETIFKLWQQTKAVVPAPVLEAMAKKLGVDLDALSAALAKKVSATEEDPEKSA